MQGMAVGRSPYGALRSLCIKGLDGSSPRVLHDTSLDMHALMHHGSPQTGPEVRS